LLSTSIFHLIGSVCGWRRRVLRRWPWRLRDRAERTALGGDAVENLIDRGDELVDALAFERGDDVVVVDADSVELFPENDCPVRRFIAGTGFGHTLPSPTRVPLHLDSPLGEGERGPSPPFHKSNLAA
jgi:hypothetical protein